MTAVSFVTAVDDPARFVRSSGVGTYFGLTPRRYQSGEVDRDGSVSQCGDTLTRTYLFEGRGHSVGTGRQMVCAESVGRATGARRIGNKKARVAVARDSLASG